MKKMIIEVIVMCAMCGTVVACSDAAKAEPTDTTSSDRVELSMTDYNRIHLWIATCVSDDDTYGNYVSLRAIHPDWYNAFHDGTADFKTLMEIGRFYWSQDIYGDTTGEGDWQKEELVMLKYWGIDDEDRI